VWELLAYDAVSSLGGGLVLPFLIIYLSRVRDIRIEVAGLAMGSVAVAGMIAGPITGSLVDRFGARRSLMGALSIAATGALLLAWVRVPWQAFVACAVFGAGEAAFWPSIQSLFASLVTEQQRSSVFAVHYATINAGFGVGGIVGGLIANVDSPFSFELLYILDAFTFVPFLVLIARSRDIGGKLVASDVDSSKVGYLTVFKDKVFVRVWLLMVILATIGYAQIESGFPAFAVGGGGVTTRSVGIAFACNTFMVVAAQFFTLRWMEGKRRTRAMMVLCGMWAICWALVYAFAGISLVVTTIGFSAALGFFAIGETLLSPTIGVIVTDIAPEHLRGRYNAVYAFSWSLGTTIGPPIAAFLIGSGLGRELFLGLVAACGLAALYSRGLERILPARANLNPAGASPQEA
jgi:MFS family permease